MDNRKIDVTAEGNITPAVSLIWPNAAGGMVTHYRIVKLKKKVDYYNNPTTHHSVNLVEDDEGTPTLILLWSKDKGAEPLPFPLELDGTISFINEWLKAVDYDRRPDIDGDLGRGWRIFTEDWGHVAGNSHAVLGVQPAWAMYGK